MSRFQPFPPRGSVLASGLFAFSLAAGVLMFQPATAAAQTPPAPAPAPKPAPDVLIFTNGDQLTGTLERGVGDSIVFKSDMAGEITVPLDKVKELRSNSNFAVLRKDVPLTRKAVEAGTIKLDDGNITVSSSSSSRTIETIPVKQLAFIIDSPTYTNELEGHKKPWQGWNGSITAGATIVRSTQTGSNFNASVTAIRAIPTVPYLPKRSRSIFNLSETYGKLTQPAVPQSNIIASVTKTNIFHTDFEQDQYFSARLYALGTTSLDHNFSQGLDLQQVYGAGIGWTPVQNAKQQLDLTVNIHYEKQTFELDASNQNLIGATIAENYMRNLPGKLVFTESLNALPAFNNSNAYSANATAGLALPVYHRLSVSFNTTDNFLNNPSPGFKKNSYQFVTGLTYTLH
ncbi:DUF481 domain-containing protein [Granulicella sp. dw_53]|uniref:DUF481 domain-containing protein n=1 Tax=Granulicella sp. dw_53 TaxID=2719792 RepID=UPI002104A818|nr:DUF481 domain-containing protein [Granulicella sp. dw_53]